MHLINRSFIRCTIGLMVAGFAFFSTAGAQDALHNLRITAPLDTIAPGTSHDLGMVWDGGEPPWSWTLEISMLDDPDRIFQQTGLGDLACDDAVNKLDCRSSPIPTSFRWPEIATIRATVEDSVGNLRMRTARVRVAGDGAFWYESRPKANVVEDGFGAFNCRGGPNDPPVATLSGDPSQPDIDAFQDDRLGSPYRLRVTELGVHPLPDQILYDISRIEWIDHDGDDFNDVLRFPW